MSPPSGGLPKAAASARTLVGSVLYYFFCLCATTAYAQQAPPVAADQQQLMGRADFASDRKPFISGIFPEELPPLLADTDATRWMRRARMAAKRLASLIRKF